MTEYDTKSVPESENTEIYHFCLLIGKQESIIPPQAALGLCSPKLEVGLTKAFLGQKPSWGVKSRRYLKTMMIREPVLVSR